MAKVVANRIGRDSNSRDPRRNKSVRLFSKTTIEECVSSGVGGKAGDHRIIVRSEKGNGMGRIRSRVAHSMVARTWDRVGTWGKGECRGQWVEAI